MNRATDSIHTSFLARQAEAALALSAASDLLRIIPAWGEPPFRYIARFTCKGLARTPTGQIVEHSVWDIGIQFPPGYVRNPSHPAEVLAFLGTGERSNLAPFHPNIRDRFICMEVTPGLSLTEICYGLFDLLTWRLYSTRDEGLNHEAAQFARNQPASRFPVDSRPLKRRASAGFTVEELTARP
jgi:hypothetical protein